MRRIFNFFLLPRKGTKNVKVQERNREKGGMKKHRDIVRKND